MFQGINNAQKQYNWLITDCECYPKNKEIEELFDQKYCWLSGEELTDIVVKEDFQWIWGCLCGFQKDISLEEVLMHSLPSSQDYNRYYQNPVSLQHPLSSVEIVPSDSSWTLIISKDNTIIDSYIKKYPKSEDLSAFNQRLDLHLNKSGKRYTFAYFYLNSAPFGYFFKLSVPWGTRSDASHREAASQ